MISLIVGVALVVGSVVWTSVIPEQAIWSAQQASRVTQNAVEIHNQMSPNGAAHRHNRDRQEDGPDFEEQNPHARAEELMQEHAVLREELDQARFMRYRLPILLRVVGFVLILVGGLFVLNQDHGSGG